MAGDVQSLGDMLVAEGVLSRGELQEALEKSRTRNLSLEETLFKLGYITHDRLGSLLAKQYKCDFIDLRELRITDEALRALPAEKALRLHALPYAIEGEALAVALAAPFEGLSFAEIVADLERATGKKVRASLCSPEPLREMLQKYYTGSESSQVVSPGQDEFSFMIRSIKSEEAGGGLRAYFEELNDIGQTALIAARSHPFSRSVANAIEEARVKLADSRKYAESGFDEEAVEMARQAISMVNEASAKADAVEKDWEKLMQQVKSLRARINALEEDGAAEYAPAEFKRLADIRDELLHCATDRNVDRLRFLLEQGATTTETVGLLAPDRNRGREQVITSLAKVREVIARARKAGAKDHAQDAIKQAYEFLDRAETHARHAQWDEVRECLASAESKALEAERIAIEAEEEKKRLTVKLREVVRAATGALEEAMARRYAHEVIDDLMQARDAINAAKACFESGELENGIGLAENAAKMIKDEIIIRAEEAERVWDELLQRATDLFQKADAASSPDVAHYCPDLVHTLRARVSEMVEAVALRSREKLRELILSVEENMGAIVGAIERAKAERYRDISEQLVEIERAIQKAVQSCSGNYSPDMLESAYLDLNRMKQQIAGGPNALNAVLENNLLRDLSVARTKVWQVEFLRERFEAEQRENLNHLRSKMEAAREAIEACTTLDFVGDESTLVAKARSLLEQADNLLIEGDIDESFELVRQSQAAAEKICLEAGEREQRWNALIQSLAAEDAPYAKILSDATAMRIAPDECAALSAMVSHTHSMIESRCLDTRAEHAEKLERLIRLVADKVKKWREQSLGEIETRFREAREEIRLAQILNAEVTCPDVLNAALAYLDVAQGYAAKDEFNRAALSVSDALAKARDAATLAQAATERSANLALDYMKIASAQIVQQRPEAAKETLERGIALAELSRTSSHKE
ncbi:MAG: hypothetical protein HY801_01150 [Candidatus Lindowbacteria bacterium]|nr:hypothetical protein [Candidatus Lindowbacteria bacterium]